MVVPWPRKCRVACGARIGGPSKTPLFQTSSIARRATCSGDGPGWACGWHHRRIAARQHPLETTSRRSSDCHRAGRVGLVCAVHFTRPGPRCRPETGPVHGLSGPFAGPQPQSHSPVMTRSRYLPIAVLVCAVMVAATLHARAIAVRLAAPSAPRRAGRAARLRFRIGTWKTHLSRLSASTHRLKDLGRIRRHVRRRRVWSSRANLGGARSGRSRRPSRSKAVAAPLQSQAHRWSLNRQRRGRHDQRADRWGVPKWPREFFRPGADQRPRTVLVPQRRSDIPPRPALEQAFSDDGGKTWEVNWIANDTR